MSVYIKPCHGCPLGKGCQQRNEFRVKVAGLGLRSATFDCSILKEKLAPGTRVVIAVPIMSGDEYGEYYLRGRREVKATVHASKGNRFACIVDREHEEAMLEDSAELKRPERIRFRKMQNHTRIVRWLDEPKRRMCGLGSPMLDDGTCDRPAGEQCWCKQDQFKEAAE